MSPNYIGRSSMLSLTFLYLVFSLPSPDLPNGASFDPCSPLLRGLKEGGIRRYLRSVKFVPAIVSRDPNLRDLRNRLIFDYSFIPKAQLPEMSADLMYATQIIRRFFEEEGLPYYWHSSKNHSLSDQGLTAHILTYPFADRKIRRILYLLHALSHPIDDAIDDAPLKTAKEYHSILKAANSAVLRVVDLRLHNIGNRILDHCKRITKVKGTRSRFFEDHFLRGVARTYIARGMFDAKMNVKDRRGLRMAYQDYLAIRADDLAVTELIRSLHPIHVALTTKVLAESYFGPIAHYLSAEIFIKFRAISLLMELVYAPVAALNNHGFEIEDGDFAAGDMISPEEFAEGLGHVVHVMKKELSPMQIQFIMMPLAGVLAIYGDAMKAKGFYNIYRDLSLDLQIGPLIEPKQVFNPSAWNRQFRIERDDPLLKE